MFESAKLKHHVDKAVYRREEAKLRSALLNAQFELKEQGRFPVLILIAGVEGAGKGETVNLLNEWMDPRHIHARAFSQPSDEERERPPAWRFWRALPPKGEIGIFFGAWHTMPIVQRVMGQIDKGEFSTAVGEIQRLEKMLCDEGVLLVKYWFHLSKGQQKKRLHALEQDPKTRWRVTDVEWDYFKQYDRFIKVCEPFLRETSTGEAPWIVVPGADPHFRALTVGRHLLTVMRKRLDEENPKAPPKKAAPKKASPLPAPTDRLNVLSALELDQKMTKDAYGQELEEWQARLNLASRDPRFKAMSVVAVFEGNDGAGKGGAIRRVTQALDARCYDNVPVAAPTEEERAQPYLWRFWRHLPRHGNLAIFDRSWYGRVLVERIEGFCSDADWMRAYGEINDFEDSMVRHGSVVVKFWLAISKDEQYRRFKQREKVAFKRFKITKEDWRNRKKWDGYEAAVCDMVDRTSTASAPWTLVEANNKYHARIKVLKTLCTAIEDQLDRIPKKAIGRKSK
ncbi:polyphosphate:AMP phosphotransferase [Bradyrhizobium guangdongense]|uniref:polyphosphate:AMP phosphotransferase n=1 Tax=Bradyrhizobium guangdongense TaxID=1325090 RepID=UPI00112E84F3|nr:polyphosphate:AMP phosphotransferase [Bradyrhizobium guangdongense]TPQ39109.1 polyphosphate:AMP phosphotransferase [Bradyrhizobium guangdongense]